jgi:hypothetical protein
MRVKADILSPDGLNGASISRPSHRGGHDSTEGFVGTTQVFVSDLLLLGANVEIGDAQT